MPTNKEALLKTAITYWDTNDECYITESPLDDGICGTGETPEESMESYKMHVEAHYEHYKRGKHAIYNSSGRPRKGKTRFHAEINPAMKTEIAELARSFGISQGEAVEYFYSFWKANQKTRTA